jgi:hypothetical protein
MHWAAEDELWIVKETIWHMRFIEPLAPGARLMVYGIRVGP